MTPEHARIDEADRGTKKWRRWGTYLSERQWGTVREDYSAGGDAWNYFPFDHAHLRAYRWGEDGLLGLTDNRGLVCFSIALWNGKDPILKERLFGLSGPEGNHGEDVKESYWYLESTPTSSHCHALYKYPQREFPYDELRDRNGKAGRGSPEIDLADTGVFADDRYFDVEIRYVKADVDDVLVEIRVTNRGPDEAPLVLIPQLWCRNTWGWGDSGERPRIGVEIEREGVSTVRMDHFHFGTIRMHFEGPDEVVFTENETNKRRLWNVDNAEPWVKDAFHRYVVNGDKGAVNPLREGSKVGAIHRLRIGPGQTKTIRARMVVTSRDERWFGQIVAKRSRVPMSRRAFAPFEDFDAVVRQRAQEADEFYAAVLPPDQSEDQRRVTRQALGGLLWSRQYYNFDVNRWLRGDPNSSAPPKQRKKGRNHEWVHLFNSEVISMPDKWEYPWYAAWDTAFHAVPLALVDMEFAKSQIMLFLREWYMHPNGQIPAYEWSFSDVNPPVQAWAALRLYRMEKDKTGKGDHQFLESVFHKLMLNFTWWVNRKDAAGLNVFEGGFLGLDNIGVFDRSSKLPTGGRIEQADATSWMGMYCLDLLEIALELAQTSRAYEDVANKFFEHFLYISYAMNCAGDENEGMSLWDDEDGFYYDVLNVEGRRIPLRVRSMVGLIPLFGVEILEPSVLAQCPGFVKRMRWFLRNRPDLAQAVAHLGPTGEGERQLLSLVNEEKLRRILTRMLAETEFLSPHGVRALSRYHRDRPYVFFADGEEHRVDYEPAESRSWIFGGNSNWRGPVWFPVNFLILESLMKFHRYFGDRFRIECPIGSGRTMNLREVAIEIGARLTRIFLRDEQGNRPVYGDDAKHQRDPAFRDNVLFYEYFHGETGQGLGAGHQTGWTALVANLLAERW